MKKIIFLIPLILCAYKLEVIAKKCQKDLVCIKIHAEGNDIYFPFIKKIGKYKIISTYFNTDISLINNKIKEKASETIIIKADKNITIPPISVFIDGKEFKTKPIKIN